MKKSVSVRVFVSMGVLCEGECVILGCECVYVRACMRMHVCVRSCVCV